jgi:RIO kinase 1
MLTVRKIYHTCKLVHADLSEYNILYHADELWIIDVSQSVEQDHPSAFEFLRMDLKNVKAFFEGRGVRCLTVVRAFEFVTREVFDKEEAEVLREWVDEGGLEGVEGGEEQGNEEVKTKLEDDAAAHKATEDSVFMRSFIPRSLNEMIDPERTMLAASATAAGGDIGGETKALPDSVEKGAKVRFTGVPRQEGESDYSSSEEEDGSEGDAAGGEFREKQPRGHRHEDKDAKKV